MLMNIKAVVFWVVTPWSLVGYLSFQNITFYQTSLCHVGRPQSQTSYKERNHKCISHCMLILNNPMEQGFVEKLTTLAQPDKKLLTLMPRLNVFLVYCLKYTNNLLFYGVISVRDRYIEVFLVLSTDFIILLMAAFIKLISCS